ncbi:carbohydrate ABC transporter permease [Armatimonas sp.]|uniref:carbohydrate ABC transporter permease n=1 Tax=Armatimonas sp. TaxID=1872638 RepID=UPI002869FD04|nr:carbohydrate ABC transporter permease [Armatimonas sp.]
MNAFLWLLAIIAIITALIYGISVIVAAVRVRNLAAATVTAAVLAAMLAVTLLVRFAPVSLALGIVVALGSARWLRALTRNASHAGELTRLSATHLALLVGSFMFMVPFAWLLSTSLKADDEQAVFPPVWIPTQHRTTDLLKMKDGKPARLSQATAGDYAGMLVAEIEELPDGKIMVKPMINENAVQGMAPPKPMTRSELTKLRHVAPKWENYSEALAYLPPDTYYGLTFLGNTLFLTLMSVLGTLLASSMVAYSFARLSWPGRNLLFGVLLATMMVPGAVTLMPQFLIFRSLGWVDTLKPLWVPAFFGSAFNIFMLRQFFLSIPGELEDAAKIDGCGPFGVYWRVMLPQVKPALAAIAIMAVMGAWNNFQGPLIYLSSAEHMPLAYGLQLYQQQHGGEPGLLMAASTMVVMPIILLFFFTQRYFIEGVSLTGLGGR